MESKKFLRVLVDNEINLSHKSGYSESFKSLLIKSFY